MHILQQLLLAATPTSAIVAIAALINAVKTYRRQMNAEIFIKYTERYERILEQFPEDALAARFDVKVLPAQSSRLRLCVLKYLNLCSEEYYLTRHGYLDQSLWRIWEVDLKRIIGSPLVQREWPSLRTEFLAHKEFLQYVEGVQSDVRISKAAHA